MTDNEGLADLLGLTIWREAMLSVPRDVFVPDVGLACPEGGSVYPIDRVARPDEWRKAVYSDTAIITQRDDGQGDPLDAAAGVATSSLSAPGVAFSFLDLLAPHDPDRVLDIGTGTGYTACVLAARLGNDNVTSIEVDAEVAKQAAANVEAAGFTPRLITGDGATGYADGMPYDRVHATCAVAEIPYSWVEQVRPGGVIVAPWQLTITYGWKTRLITDGNAAYGRFYGRCGYMMLRDQRAATFWQAHHAEEADSTSTRLDPRSIDQADPGVILAATGQIPRLAMFRDNNADGSFSLLLSEVGDPQGGSWAACDYEPGKDEFEVYQYGDRRLWDELEHTFYWWVRHGSPAVERFGLAVSPEGQNVWLDEPTHLV